MARAVDEDKSLLEELDLVPLKSTVLSADFSHA